MRLIIITSFLFLLSSCATIFNLPEQRMTIAISEPSKITVNQVYSDSSKKTFNIDVPRSKKPLNLTVEVKDAIKYYTIKSHTSFAYWLNIYPSYGLGMLVDKNSPERYSYPKAIFIDNHKEDNTYLTYIPLDSTTANLKNIIKITPFRFFSFSNSSFEISLERKTGSLFSSQLMLSYLLPKNALDYGNNFNYKYKGYRVSFEEKLYLKRSSPIGPYLGFEINHLRSNYRDIAWFGPPGINSDTAYYSHFNEYGDSINLQKHTTSLNLKFGYQEITGRFSFDFFCGLGARYRNVIHQNRINPTDEMEIPRHPNFYYVNNNERKNWTIVLLLNVRIGWIF